LVNSVEINVLVYLAVQSQQLNLLYLYNKHYRSKLFDYFFLMAAITLVFSHMILLKSYLSLFAVQEQNIIISVDFCAT